MSQPGTQSLREKLKEYRDAPNGIGPHEFEWRDKPHRVLWDLCDAVEALLPSLESAIREWQPRVLTGKRLEETIRAYCGRDMTEGINWSSIAARLNADAAVKTWPEDTVTTHTVSNAPPPLSELGNLKTARELAHLWLMNERSDYGSDTQEEAEHSLANLIAAHAEQHASQAVAQARVDEAKWWASDINQDWSQGITEKRRRRVADLRRDLAAIAKEEVK